jgi:hypothetical protein
VRDLPHAIPLPRMQQRLAALEFLRARRECHVNPPDGLVASALGVRGNALFWLIGLGWLPASVVVMAVSLRLFPPNAHLTGEFRGILVADSTRVIDSDEQHAIDSKDARD